MAKHGKKYREASALVDREQVYQPLEAVELAKATTFVAFDASMEVHLKLGVDPRHADQMVRGTVVLPHGTGKQVRVAVFAQGEKAQEALAPAPTRSVARTWSRRSRPAGSSSMSPSRRPTRWAWSGSSARSSAVAA
jgi:ribosomal protein L1